MNTSAVNNILSRAEVKCKESGAKLTEKRKLVLRQLIETNKLLSAYEIVDRMKTRSERSMPAMSVYRILDFLESASLVHKIESQNKYVACRHIQCDHQHQSAQFLICQSCDYVREINLNHIVLEDVQRLAEMEDFNLEFSVMEFNGLCHNCQQTNA